MDLFSLLCFVTLARCTKFYEAAETLHLSQSSFSKHIQALERELGATLFIRQSQGSELTEAGKVLLPYAESIMQEYSKAEHLIGVYKKNSNNRLSVYTHSFLSTYKLTDIIFRFQNRYPDAQLEINELESRTAIQALKNDSSIICIVFTDLSNEAENTEQCILLQDDLVLLVSKQHHLSDRDKVNLSMLQNERFQIMLRRQAPFLYDFVTKQCKKAGFTPKINPNGLWFSTISGVLENQNYISVLPRKIAESIATSKMRIIEIEGADAISVVMMKNRNNSSPISSAFFGFFKTFSAINYTI